MKEYLKSLSAEIKHNPEALFELRQLLFGLIIVVGMSYGLFSFYVQSKQKDQVKLINEKVKYESLLGNGSLESLTQLQLDKLSEEEQEVKGKVGLLQFKKQMFREQYVQQKSDQAFSNVIFTLLPRSPVDIEGDFSQMNVLEKRVLEYYEILPVNIKGQSHYADLVSYLQYLEVRPEVGVIESLKLLRVEPASFDQVVEIQFDLVVGRVKVN